MLNFNLVWGPTGQVIATVQASTPRAAVRKAPLPWRRYLGEIRAEEVRPVLPEAPLRYTRCILCGSKLPSENRQPNGIPTRSQDIARMDPEVRFCGLRCAARYGCLCAHGHEVRGNDISFKGVKP